MTKNQKIIKYFGITLAIFIIISIFIILFLGIKILLNILDDKDISNIETNKYVEVNNNYELRYLDIELSTTNLTIKKGTTAKVETNNEDIKVSEENGRLMIREKEHKWFKNKDDYNIIVYLPTDKVFERIDIEAGAGKVDIEFLQTNNLEFEFGAGYAKIMDLIVYNETIIDGGAGKLDILNANLNNLDLDMGVGKVSLTSKLSGNINIDADIGSLDLNIIGKKEDFRIRTDKGIGGIYLDSIKLEDNKFYGNGPNYLEIDGGIGKIQINFINN